MISWLERSTLTTVPACVPRKRSCNAAAGVSLPAIRSSIDAPPIASSTSASSDGSLSRRKVSFVASLDSLCVPGIVGFCGPAGLSSGTGECDAEVMSNGSTAVVWAAVSCGSDMIV